MSFQDMGLDGVVEALLDARGLQAISDAAAATLGNPFWVVDMDSRQITNISGETNDFHLLEESRVGYTDNRTVQYTETKHVHGNDPSITEPVVFQAFGSDRKILSAPVMIEQIPVAYVNTIDEHHPFAGRDMARMPVIARIIATELEKNELYRNNKEIMFSYFLSDLLEDRVRYKDIDKRLSVLGYTVGKYCYLLNVALPNTQNRRIVLRSISAQISAILRNSIGCFYEDHYLYFFSSDTVLEEDGYTMHALEKFLDQTRLKAAISDAFHSIALVHRNYEKTRKALELGTANNPDQVLYHYSELVIDYAVSLIQTGMSWHDFSHGAIDVLVAYDEENRSSLLETLRSFLSNAGSVSRTAQTLHLHENTVRQRMQKIRTLTGVRFDSGRQVFELTIALELYDYSKMSNGKDAEGTGSVASF